jgi:hypothetical protein
LTGQALGALIVGFGSRLCDNSKFDEVLISGAALVGMQPSISRSLLPAVLGQVI